MIKKETIKSDNPDNDQDENGIPIPFRFRNLVQRADKTVTVFTINIDDDVIDPTYYREAFDVLRSATEDDVIIFSINTNGGDVSTFVQMYSLMKRSPAWIVADLFKGFSVGSLLCMAADQLLLNDFSAMLLHAGSSVFYGKANELESQSKFYSKYLADIDRTLYKGFLTNEEIERMLKGEDFYFDKAQIEKRWENRQKVLIADKKKEEQLEQQKEKTSKSGKTKKKNEEIA